MRNHKMNTRILIFSISLLLCGCASINVPENYLANADDKATDVYGSWINIETNNKTNPEYYSGELIAVNPDSIFILSDKLITLKITDINTARLVNYNSDAGTMGGLATLGTISTLSHGWYLIITAPLWLITGTISSVARSYEPIMDFPDQPLTEFAHFARFPQGLTKGINRAVLKPKPIVLKK